MLLIAGSVHCCLVFTCWKRADLLALVCDVKLGICHFSMWYPGSGVVLDCIFPDLCPFITLYQAICIVQYYFFMILLENIKVRQRSNFIEFIYISFKDPRLISSDHWILPTLIRTGICFGIRVLVMICLITATNPSPSSHKINTVLWRRGICFLWMRWTLNSAIPSFFIIDTNA